MPPSRQLKQGERSRSSPLSNWPLPLICVLLSILLVIHCYKVRVSEYVPRERERGASMLAAPSTADVSPSRKTDGGCVEAPLTTADIGSTPTSILNLKGAEAR